MPVEVEIGTLGRKVDSRGVAKEFTPEFFAEVAESYNPSNFKAPAIISHDTKGIPDDKLHKNKELSYGSVSAVKFAGDRLKVVFNKLSPKIKEYFDNGELLSVSPSFYPPGHHANPTPGKWSLRHTAFLGSSPPAIKGMTTPQFSEKGFNPTQDTLNFSFPVDLNEDGGTWRLHMLNQVQRASPLEFSIGSSSIRSLFSNLRDWLIEKHGVEETQKILPGDAIAEIQAGDRYQQEEINRLVREIDDLKSFVRSVMSEVARDPPPPMMYEEETPVNLKEYKGKTMKTANKTKAKNGTTEEEDMDLEDVIDEEVVLEEDIEEVVIPKKKKKTMDLNEQEHGHIKHLSKAQVSCPPVNYAEELAEERRQRKLLELQFQNERRKAEAARALQREKDITSFCEGLVKDGQLTAAQMGDRLLEFGEGEEVQQTLPQFMMSLDDEQLSFMEDFLSTAPQVIEYGEFAPDNESVNRHDSRIFAAVDGATISDESRDEYEEILHYCETHSLDPNSDEDFNKAASFILK